MKKRGTEKRGGRDLSRPPLAVFSSSSPRRLLVVSLSPPCRLLPPVVVEDAAGHGQGRPGEGDVTLDLTFAPAVPEASTTVSLGLLLALGMGGLVVANRRKKRCVGA